jgi:hypothetical protein
MNLFCVSFAQEWLECCETKFVGPEIIWILFNLRLWKEEFVQSAKAQKVRLNDTILNESNVRMVVAC